MTTSSFIVDSAGVCTGRRPAPLLQSAAVTKLEVQICPEISLLRIAAQDGTQTTWWKCLESIHLSGAEMIEANQ